MLRRGGVRVKQPLATGGMGQTLVTIIDEFDALLERLPENEIASYGIVIEENLRHVTTRSVGHITVDDRQLFWNTKVHDEQLRAIGLRRLQSALRAWRMGSAR
jgi:Protein of unknown function (DUF3182)